MKIKFIFQIFRRNALSCLRFHLLRPVFAEVSIKLTQCYIIYPFKSSPHILLALFRIQVKQDVF